MYRAHEAYSAGEEIGGEHVVMLRQWSACQQRVSLLVRDYQQQIAHLQAQVLQLRAQRLLQITRRDWGLEPQRPAR